MAQKLSDPELLRAALVGNEHQRDIIGGQIAEIQARIGGALFPKIPVTSKDTISFRIKEGCVGQILTREPDATQRYIGGDHS